MSNKLEAIITADDTQFKATMNRVQGSVSKVQPNLEKTATAVSGLGSAFGGLQGPMGAVTGAASNMAMAFVAGGPLLAGIALAVAGLSALITKFQETSQAAEDEAKRVVDAHNSLIKSIQEATKKIQDDVLFFGFAGEARTEQEIQDKLNNLGDKLRKKADEIEGLKKQAANAPLKSNIFGSLEKEGATERQQRIEILNKENTAILEQMTAYKKNLSELQKFVQLREDETEKTKKATSEQKKLNKAKAKEFDINKYVADVASNMDSLNADRLEEERKFNEMLAADKWATEYETWEKKKQLDEKSHEEELKRIAEQRAAKEESARRDLELQQQLKQQKAQDLANEIISGAMFAQQQASVFIDHYARMAAARKAGNQELVNQLKGQEKDLIKQVLASTMQYLSQVAIGKGAIQFLEGVGELSGGNPGGIGKMAAGGALVALGLGGMMGSSAITSTMGVGGGQSSMGAIESSGSSTISAPTGDIGAGSQATAVTHVTNYNFNGNVFGDYDATARAITRFNQRGKRLEGLQP